MKLTLDSLGASVSSSDEVVYLYEGHMRVRCPDGSKTGTLERKNKMMDVNVALPSAAYDFRLSLATEDQTKEGQDPEEHAWVSKRHKVRTSYRDAQGNATLGPWALDMTTVVSTDRKTGQEEESSEVEMELDMSACGEWLQADSQEEADTITSRLASRLLDVIQRLNPMESATAESFLKEMDRPQVAGAARARCQDVGGRNFPGTMPVNLCRKDVALVQQGDYWLAEKTDGVRYFLIVAEDRKGRAATLVDRSMSMFSFPGCDVVGSVLPHKSILDGELVYNRTTNTYIFLVFDVLFWGEKKLMDSRYADRLRAIHLRVIPAYESAVKKGAIPSTGPTLRLVGKKFYRRHDISRLFDRVVEESGHRVYKDPSCISEYLQYLGIASEASSKSSPESSLARYCHKTDGIVFQPNTPYQVSTDKNFFKWKWMDTVTIDFGVTRLQQGLGFECGIQGKGLDLSKIITLEKPDLMRLRADMSAAGCRIAELGVSPETGFWTYKKLRPDKDKPNFYTTVFNTMLELAEAVDEEELQYRVTADHPAKDDWIKQRGAMMKAALLWKQSMLEERGDEDDMKV